jgi:protein-arginine kinase
MNEKNSKLIRRVSKVAKQSQLMSLGLSEYDIISNAEKSLKKLFKSGDTQVRTKLLAMMRTIAY